MYLYLCRWWSQYYKRPFKDPILQQYTFEELMYEYYSVVEHHKSQSERDEKDGDRIEQEQWDEAEDWADQMEEEEEQALKKKKEKPNEPYDPLKDPKNVEWMEEELAKDRERFGDSFGEDLNIDFESD